MSRRDYSCSITMSDLLFNMLLAFVALFILAFAQMAVKQQNKSVDMKAEYLITVSWPNEFDDDVDVYVEDPQGHLVFFRRREDGLMHLDRDDQGRIYDYIETPFGRVEYKENRELVTIRGSVAGEYTINLHMFRRGNKNQVSPQPCPVMVQLDQLTPFRTLGLKTVMLERNGEEKTVFRFTLTPDANNKMNVGQITDIFKSLTARTFEGQDVPQSSYNGERAVPPPGSNTPPPTIPE